MAGVEEGATMTVAAVLLAAVSIALGLCIGAAVGSIVLVAYKKWRK